MTKMYDQTYWDTRYQQAQTGWDVGHISTPLKDYFDQLTDKNQAILIPGCGNAYEATYLLQNGFTDVTLLDISPKLVENLRLKLVDFEEVGAVKIVLQDFFEHTGQYDLIIEQTFFCALDPSLRLNYARKMYELLKPNRRLVGLLFDKTFEGGPPFGGSVAEYQVLFEPYFELQIFEKAYNSIRPRAGAELFVKMIKPQI